MAVIGRGQIELVSNADDVNKGFLNTIQTLGKTNEAVKAAQQQLLNLTNTDRELTAQLERLHEKHMSIVAALEATTKGSKAHTEAQKQEASILKEIEATEEKYVQQQNKIADGHRKLAEATAQSGGAFAAFGNILTNIATHPVTSVQSAITGLTTSLGPTAMGFMGIATAVGVAAMGLHKLAEEARGYGQAIQNLSFRTGLTTTQVQAVGRMGEEFGVGNIAQTLGAVQRNIGTEGSSLLSGMASQGVRVTDTAGQIRPLLDLLGDFSDRLKLITNEEERAQVANAVLGRRLESLSPILGNTSINFREYLAGLEKTVPLTQAAIEAQSAHAREINRLMHEWEEAKLKMGAYWADLEAHILHGVGSAIMATPGTSSITGGKYAHLAIPAGGAATAMTAADFPIYGPQLPAGGIFDGKVGMAAMQAREAFKAQMDLVLSGQTEDLDLRRQIAQEKEKYQNIANSGTKEEIQLQAEKLAGLNSQLQLMQDTRREYEAVKKDFATFGQHLLDDYVNGYIKNLSDLEKEMIKATGIFHSTMEELGKLSGKLADEMASNSAWIANAADAAARSGGGLMPSKGETTSEALKRMMKPSTEEMYMTSEGFFGYGKIKPQQDNRAFEYWKHAASSMFDAVTASGVNMWTSLANWGKTTLLTIIKDIFSSAVGSLLGGGGSPASAISGLFGGVGTGKGILSGLFDGHSSSTSGAYLGTSSQISSIPTGLAGSLSNYSSLITAGGLMAGSMMLGSAWNNGSPALGAVGGGLAGAGVGLSMGIKIGGASAGPLGMAIGAAVGAVAGLITGLKGGGEKRRQEEAARRALLQSTSYVDITSATNPQSSVESDITGHMSDWAVSSRPVVIVNMRNDFLDVSGVDKIAPAISAAISRALQNGQAGPLIDTLAYIPA